MNQKWYWIELIGFDKEQPDLGVEDFLSRIPKDICGISLLLYTVDFVCLHTGLAQEQPLPRAACSYGGHPYNEERKLQSWTNWELKRLIESLHHHGVKVLLSFFDLHRYRAEDGSQQDGDFVRAHPELLDFNSALFLPSSNVNILKRFEDGSYFRDFLMEKIRDVLQDYGFDGYQMADGLSSPRACIQSGNFQDDLVEQFLDFSGLTLPSGISLHCDNDRESHLERYDFLMKNHRYDYTLFLSRQFELLYKKAADMVSSLGKLLIVNNAWTRNPFEALFRYGIDYRTLCAEGVSGTMIEDTGATMAIFSEMDQGGFRVPDIDRKYTNYAFFLTQLTVKAHAPQLSQLNMTPIKDTFEQWNLVDSMPLELEKMIVRRNNAYFTDGHGLQKVSDGAVYCLSDGLKRETWDTIHRQECFAQLPAPQRVMGFTALWNDAILHREVQRFISDRSISTNALLERLMESGVPVASAARVQELDCVDSALLVVHPDLYDPPEREQLESYTKNSLVLLGYANPLKRRADYILSDSSGLAMYLYNTSLEGHREIRTAYSPVSTDFRDSNGGIWTSKLRYVQPSQDFLKEAAALLDRIDPHPVIVNEACCKLLTFYTAPDKLLLFLFNDNFYAEYAHVRMPFPIRRVVSLSKPAWYEVEHSTPTDFFVRTGVRAVEVLEIQL